MKAQPQDANQCYIHVPDTVGLRGPQQVPRFRADRFGHRRPGPARRTRRFDLPQNTLHGGTADRQTGTDDVTGNGVRAKFLFRTKPPEFMHPPTHRVIHAIPDNRAMEETDIAATFDGFDPLPDRVGMHDEAFRRFDDAPIWPARIRRSCKMANLCAG